MISIFIAIIFTELYSLVNLKHDYNYNIVLATFFPQKPKAHSNRHEFRSLVIKLN